MHLEFFTALLFGKIHGGKLKLSCCWNGFGYMRRLVYSLLHTTTTLFWAQKQQQCQSVVAWDSPGVIVVEEKEEEEKGLLEDLALAA